MGIFVIYTVGYIISSSCFQVCSNKNIGNVILFALQINHLDSLLNIFINLKDCKAFLPINQAWSSPLPSAGSETQPRLKARNPKEAGFHIHGPVVPLSPFMATCTGRSAANRVFVLQYPVSLENRSTVLSFVPV